MSGIYYGSDVPVSMPQPPPSAVASVPMYGFVFTENGLGVDITETDRETLAIPTFAPDQPDIPTEWTVPEEEPDVEREFL